MMRRYSSLTLWLGAVAATALAAMPLSGQTRDTTRDTALPAVAVSLYNSITSCWNAPPDAVKTRDAVRFRLEFHRDGSLAREPVLLNPRADAGFKRLAESARRAIQRCAPFRDLAQHPETYRSWRVIMVNFRPPVL